MIILKLLVVLIAVFLKKYFKEKQQPEQVEQPEVKPAPQPKKSTDEVLFHYPKEPKARKEHRKRSQDIQLPPAHLQHVTKKEIMSWLKSVKEFDDFRQKVAT